MNDIGFLNVNVYAVTIGMPLEGAIVKVTNNDNLLLTEMTTDASGKIATLQLPSPPRELSLDINNSLKPYAEYNLEITKSGFMSQLIMNIEILNGTTAIQNVIMQPSANNEDPLSRRIISIKEHTLYANILPKIPEEEIKPITLPSGYIVLDRPVIPETIVVHDGIPNDSTAPNYYVPFEEYIKNVACCEIFSTWPTATIRANVLAIISFTLNRVYTEWYRGQGKYFTITSSSAYDQAFSYQRNIFEEISVIVDELFTTYITKPNIVQPLFAQYCDGKRSTCPQWMSQWGSKELGDRGYDHISILKNYYGQDIYLQQAEKVTGIPSSFPGYNLEMGSRGEEVRIIQRQLNAISNNFPAIAKLVEDGIYGNDTINTVRTFQEVFNLPVSGIVNFATWYRISKIYVAVTKLAENV